MNFVELLVSLQWNKNHNTVKISKCLLFKLEAIYIIIRLCVSNDDDDDRQCVYS